MKQENDILAELREWGSPLANVSRAMPYDVPLGYFESNIEGIISYITSEEITPYDKAMPFDIPTGYFEVFPQQGLDLAKAESFSKEMPYTLPQGYFESLPEALLAKMKKEKRGKIIALAPRTWIKQAVAAILLVAIGIGGYEYTTHRQVTPEKQLARIPAKTIQEYVHQNLNDVDAETMPATDIAVANAIKQLDKNDIEQYLDETGLKTENSID